MRKESSFKIFYHTLLPFVQIFLRRKSSAKPEIQSWWADYLTMWVNEVIPETADGIKGQENGICFGRYDQYREAYKKRFGKEPATAFGGYGYDAVWLVALAINFANSTKPDDIRKAMFPVSGIYYGVTGKKSFNKDGMQVTDCYVRYITKAVTEAGKKKLTFAPHKKLG